MVFPYGQLNMATRSFKGIIKQKVSSANNTTNYEVFKHYKAYHIYPANTKIKGMLTGATNKKGGLS